MLHLKIVKMEVFTVALPEFTVFMFRGGPLTNKKVIVKLYTDEGIVGIGETTPVPSDWGHDADTMEIVLRRFIEPGVIGMDPYDVECIFDNIESKVGFKQIPQAMLFERAALDVALYDVMGKASGVPVNKLLGGSTKQKVAVAAVLSLAKPEEMAKEGQKFAAEGFFDFKLKVGVDPAEDVARVKAVREALGDDVDIRVDANGGWTPNTAVKTIRAMERYSLQLVEQPVPRWDVKGMAYVRDHVETPIMADESLHSISDALLLVEKEACDIFNIKFQRVGGLYNAKKILSIAEAADIECMVGSELETGVGTAAGIHLMASSKLFTIPSDLIGPIHFKDDIVKQKFTVKNGYMEVPTEPGLGVELNEEKVRMYKVS